MKRNGIAGILAVVLLSAWSLPAGAEETYKLDPVLVTAEKRTENVQDVPVSVTAISEQQIKDSGIRSIQDVARQVPNLFIANWGFRGNSYAFIRGIGAVNNDPAIGFYVDDVNYMDSRVFDTNLFDIERIEVLRGPQGTLYGRNSLGGVVNIVTKKPDNEFHYGLEQTVGNENLYETTLYMRAPLIKDKLFFGVSGTSEQMDGYNTNDFLDKKVDRRRGLNGRMQLRWMPTDKLDVTANVDGEKVNDGVFPLTDMDQADKNPHHVSYNYEGRDKRDTLGSSLRVIILLGSIAGHYGQGGVSTSAAFAGIEGVAKNLAIQYSREGIRCNAVCPGPTKHDPRFDVPTKYEFAPKEQKPEEKAFVAVVNQHRDWFESESEEQANLILFLASDEASSITGQCIVSDHGMCL